MVQKMTVSQTDYDNLQKELNHVKGQLVQAQKMQTIGLLASGIAHDFNNVLACLSGYNELTEMVMETLPENADKKEIENNLREVKTAINHAADLVRKILIYCRHDEHAELIAIQVSDIMGEAIKMLRTSVARTIKLSSHCTPNLFIVIESFELYELIINLVVNARDAIGTHGEIHVASNLVELPPHICSACKKEVSGQFVCISVSDNGIGIAQEQLNHIFEAFFTTKEVNKGTGLGLSMVTEIVHHANGHIVVESEFEKGTMFNLLFPVAQKDDEIKPLTTLTENKATLQQSLNILIVDDATGMTRFLEKALLKAGHLPTVFNDSFEALMEFKQNPQAFDIVITDQLMMRLTGLELTYEILKINPDFPVLIYTGVNDKIRTKADLPKGNVHLIKRPAPFEEILTFLNTIQPKKRQIDREQEVFCLIYCSKVIDSFSEADLLDILKISRRNNEKQAITGVFVYRQGFVLQMLEGEFSAVKKLFDEKISKDKRHYNLVTLGQEYKPQRDFPDWNMGFYGDGFDDEDLNSLSGYTNLSGHPASYLFQKKLTVIKQILNNFEF